MNIKLFVAGSPVNKLVNSYKKPAAAVQLYRDGKGRHKVHLVNQIIGGGRPAESRSGSSL